MTHCNDILRSIQAAKEKEACVFDISHLGSVYVQGKDAQKFLQGQLTCDVNTLPALKAQPTACCNLQGRIITLLFLMSWQDGYLLLLPKNMLESTLKHFKKYAIFSKVLFDINAIQSFTGFSETAPEGAYACLNNLFIKPNFSLTLSSLNQAAWHYQQMIRGFPDIYPETQEIFLPHRIGLDKINEAISFKKGCYLGQEIIARMHFKATQKHTVCLFKTQENFLPGAVLFDATGEENIGEILDVVNYNYSNDNVKHYLAAIKTEAIEKLSHTIKILL